MRRLAQPRRLASSAAIAARRRREVAGARRRSRRSGEVASLAVSEVPGRLHVPQAEPGGRGQVGGGRVVVDEAVEQAALAGARRERLAQRRGERVEDGDVGGAGLGVPVRRRCSRRRARPRPRPGSRRERPRRRPRPGRRSARAWTARRTRARGDAAPPAAKAITVTGTGHHAVGRQGVVGPAQVGAGDVVGRWRCSRRPVEDASACSTSCWGAALVAHQWPASSMVLRMLTPRNSADGQPWLTGGDLAGLGLAAVEGAAEHPGVGPPTASMEPQKSVVVAW